MGTRPNDPAPASKRDAQPSHLDVPSAIDGPLLRRLFADAGTLLHRHIDALNAINVFPVPDGDTGTNMHLTLRAGLDELDSAPADDAGAVMRAIAHGTLMGACGNSGFILSQVLDGFARALLDHATVDATALAIAFSSAVARAYAAPLGEELREGTIVTVIRETAEAVGQAKPSTVQEVLATAAAAAKASVDRTPELLPVLKEAGVVDAGGLGLAIVLEGLLRSLRGETLEIDLAPAAAVEAGWRRQAASLHSAQHGESGYCTQFIVRGRDIDRTAAGEHLSRLGTSLLIVGDEDLLRVHLHTTHPDDALAYARSLGELAYSKVDNLEAQISRFLAQEAPPPIAVNIGVVAVAAGEGVEAAFRSIGVGEIVRGGQTMNPNVGEIVAAIERCSADEVIVLPNNKNIIASAQQAAREATKQVWVIPTRSIPQGIAAALALSEELAIEENAEAMERAIASVRSAEVTRAVRATTIEGRHVDVGQAIGIIDGTLRVVTDDVAAAARQCVQEMMTSGASLLTIYAGEDVRAEDAQALAADLQEQHPSLEVQLVQGGQPHYPYILSLE